MEKVIPIARARRAPLARTPDGSPAREWHARKVDPNMGTDAAVRELRRAPVSPDISVVVPTCGRPELLNRCLQALTVQNFPPGRYEVLVVDDGPSAATRELVSGWERHAASRGLSLRYLANGGPHGPSAARNRGWRAARADIIAFTDDDTVPHIDWLSRGLRAFATGADAVCGRVEMPLSSTPTDYEADARQLETAEFVTANCLCRKDVLEALDGFDEQFRLAWREDSDFHFRLLQRGAEIIYANDALVVHPVRPAPWGVSISQQRKILFDALLYKKHPRLYRERIRASARWDYYAIVAALLTAAVAGLGGQTLIFASATAVWLLLTGWFCIKRLHGRKKSWSHLAEMVWTSVLIPPLAVFWRMVGAVRFRVGFI